MQPARRHRLLKHMRPHWGALAGHLVGQLTQRLTASPGAGEVLVHEAGSLLQVQHELEEDAE
eukprot:686039-Alexandrium_andersonii.AAC.1